LAALGILFELAADHFAAEEDAPKSLRSQLGFLSQRGGRGRFAFRWNARHAAQSPRRGHFSLGQLQTMGNSFMAEPLLPGVAAGRLRPGC